MVGFGTWVSLLLDRGFGRLSRANHNQNRTNENILKTIGIKKIKYSKESKPNVIEPILSKVADTPSIPKRFYNETNKQTAYLFFG